MKFKLVEAAESKICCICKKPFDGYGNNAEPVCSGTCCDECNMKEVIPARLKMLDHSSAEDIDEAVLNETDESGNDEVDANCDDCGAVITIPVDHDGPAYCANCMKNHLNEALEDYKITYYLSTATAERRPETIEDVENDWKEETFAADSDYDALLHALELINDVYDDTDFSTAEEIVNYFDEKDLGDGSAFVVNLEGPNGVIYDMGQTKDDFIEQVKENDEMLSYYRSVLGIDESLNEATIHMSKEEMNKLDQEVDEATKEVAKYNIPMISRKNSADDIENVPDFEAVPEDQRNAAKAAYERYKKALEARPDRAKNIIVYDESLNEGNPVSGKIPESIDSFLQDIAQMYGTIDYGDIMDHDYIEDDIRKLNNLRRRFITWAQYGDSEEVAPKFDEIANKVAEILKRVDESSSNCNEKDNKMNEDMSIRAKLKALYPELNFGHEVAEGFDDDMEFDIDESHEARLMDSLYEGSDDFDDYDDEENDEFSDCEDDECIDEEDIDYDDEDPEWWNDTLDDETGDFIYQAAEQLGLEDFWFEDNGYEGAHTPTDFGYTKDGINYEAECDYEDTDVHSVEEAVDLLKGLDWKEA